MASKIHIRKNGTYTIIFQNPLGGKYKTAKVLTTLKNLQDAIDRCNLEDVKFYAKHPYLIPSGISLDKANKRFRVYNRYHTYTSCRTLMQALEMKNEIINDLVFSKTGNRDNVKLIINN